MALRNEDEGQPDFITVTSSSTDALTVTFDWVLLPSSSVVEYSFSPPMVVILPFVLEASASCS